VRALAAVDSGHPWTGRFNLRAPRHAGFEFVQPEVVGILNTTFPYGYNDGPIWAGRGLTLAASGGVRGEFGALSFTIAPQVFVAQNASFPLAPNGFAGRGAFADPAYPGTIDLPQRFGSSVYARGDLGESRIQVAVAHFAAGLSSGSEAWGPAASDPLLLGTNAAGFPHAFLGTDQGLRLGAVTVGFRAIAGQLQQSSYSPVTGAGRRLLTGAITSISLRQLPGLEVGFARVFESAWPDSGLSLSEILSPLAKNPFKAKLTRQTGSNSDQPDNEIASVFARWLLPRAKLEFYGELAREDNAFDVRDLILEPDHDIAYTLGLQRAWLRDSNELFMLHAEVVNSAISHLANVRLQTPFYVHTFVQQGHTQRGQLLGSSSAFGGGGAVVSLNWFDARGRRTISWRRSLREPPDSPVGKRDVIHALTAEWLSFHRGFDLKPEVTLAYNLNRNAQGDALDARAAMTLQAHW